MRGTVILLAALFWALLSTTALATTIVVKPDGTGDYPTIQEAIDGGGTSLRDNQYRQPDGGGGAFQGLLTVYGRAGGDCPRCATRRRRSSRPGGPDEHPASGVRIAPPHRAPGRRALQRALHRRR